LAGGILKQSMKAISIPLPPRFHENPTATHKRRQPPSQC
jgi:hypothetical protein